LSRKDGRVKGRCGRLRKRDGHARPYLKSGRFKPFGGRTEFVPGVRAEPARELISGLGEQIDFLDEFLDANVGTTGYPGHYVRLIPSIAAGAAGKANY
jgi:hypothetical protein